MIAHVVCFARAPVCMFALSLIVYVCVCVCVCASGARFVFAIVIHDGPMEFNNLVTRAFRRGCRKVPWQHGDLGVLWSHCVCKERKAENARTTASFEASDWTCMMLGSYRNRLERHAALAT